MYKGYVVGDTVKDSRYGHVGTIAKFSRLREIDAEWVDVQRIPLTTEQILGEFVTIHVDGGGAVLVPVETIRYA